MIFRTLLPSIVLLLAIGSSLAYVPLPLLQSKSAVNRVASYQTRMSSTTIHRPKVFDSSRPRNNILLERELLTQPNGFQLHPFDAAERARKKVQHKVDLILLSENKFMQAEEGALTSLTTLDIFSSIIILSLVFSMLPVELYSLNCIP
jgi:hypothetical protein